MPVASNPKVSLKLEWVKFHQPVKGLKGQKGHYRILSVSNATKYKRGDTLTEADVDRLHASGGTTSS